MCAFQLRISICLGVLWLWLIKFSVICYDLKSLIVHFSNPFLRANLDLFSSQAAARASIEGAHVRTLAILTEEGNSGLAISHDGTILVISNRISHKIGVYSVPDEAFVAELGGKGDAPGRFDSPERLCFSSKNRSNIIVADFGNKRVQVCDFLPGATFVWILFVLARSHRRSP